MVMIDFTDPERRQQLDMKKLRMDQCWRRREIGDPTYLRSLFIMGYLPDEANTELNLLKMEEPAERYRKGRDNG
jgi:hypothetical protein